MRTIRLALLGSALLAGVALPALVQPALAQPAPPPAGPEAAPGAPMREGRPAGRAQMARGPAVAFARIDANHDGRVTMDEVWAFVQQRFAAADRNQDGALVLEEALAMPLRLEPEGAPPAGPGGPPPGGPGEPMHARMVAMVFRAVDANRDGRVTLEEIRPAVEARFRALDANGDNGVTLDELPVPPRRGMHHGPHRMHGEPPPPAR